QTAPAFAEMEAFETTEVADRAEAVALIEAGDVEAAVLPATDAPAGVMILADESAPDSLTAVLSIAPEVELLTPDSPDWGLRYALGMVFGLVFMTAAISFGTPITTSVVEEKQTRIIEILMSAVPARVLLAGKV